MSFEVYHPKFGPAGGVDVRLLKSGEFSLSKEFAAEIFSPDQEAELMYDPEREIIGIRPADPANHTYSVRTSTNSRRRYIEANQFLAHYRIPHQHQYRLHAEWNESEGILYLKQGEPEED